MSNQTTVSRTETEDGEETSKLSPSDAALGEMKRVTVTMHPERHRVSKSVADDHGLSFSGLVRRAVERHCQQLENEGVERELQPLFSKVDEQQATLETQAEQIQDVLSRLSELSEQPSEPSDSPSSQQSITEIRNQLWDILTDDAPLTIPELQSESELSRDQVQRGINALRDSHAVREAETNGDVIKWRCL